MGLRLRPAGLTLFVVFLALLGTAIRLAYQIRVALDAGLPSGVNFSYGPGITFALLWIALVTPLVMWRDEDPSQRAYHWSMPVSPVVHALARTFAGWCWLMIATALLLIGHVAIVAFTERITGVAQPYSKIASWWEWLIPFTSLTVAYLFASAAAVGARRPIVWLFGPMIIYFGAYLLAYAFIRTSVPDVHARRSRGSAISHRRRHA